MQVSKECTPSTPPWCVTPGETPGVLRLCGEIDFSVTPKVRECLKQYLAGEAPEIVLDLSELSYIDSSGLALFIETRNRLLAAGRSIRIVAISPQVRKLFNLTQLAELFGLPECR